MIIESPDKAPVELNGEWDNFQQVWLENTETDMHRVEVDQKHTHYHLVINEIPEQVDSLRIEITEGRNGKNIIGEMTIAREDFKMEEDTMILAANGLLANNPDPYRFLKCRMFSGWIQYPLPDNPDSIYMDRNLMLHDQGAMAELQLDDIDYTVELTQLQFAQTIHLMKLAVYQMPMDSVGINSRSISYTWTSPEAKRLGINLRKIVSGWTLIEPGYLNSNTMKN